MQTSTELRWFIKGRLPEGIAQWFGGDSLGGYLSPPEEREDLYLLIPDCDYLGVKMRRKGLEVKWRQTELGGLRLSNSWEGKVEKWLKWVCPDMMAPVPADLIASGQWVCVKKKRFQRLYQVEDGGLTPVPVEAPIPQGCSLEIVQLSIDSNPWWSLAFEAFGPEHCLQQNLQVVAAWASKSYRGQKLKSDPSYPYPHLLNHLNPQ